LGIRILVHAGMTGEPRRKYDRPIKASTQLSYGLDKPKGKSTAQ